jgi:Ca-activated chloride channel homolog
MSFASPLFLLLLLAVPAVAVGWVWLDRRRERAAGAWASPALLPNSVAPVPRVRRYAPLVLFLLALTFLLVGFARPQVHEVDTTAGPGATVVLTVDVSGSMAANDVRPTRLRAVRRTALRFLRTLPPTYQVALVTFGERVRLLVPPTLDHRRVVARLPAVATPLAGTSLGDAISDSVAIVIRGLDTGEPVDRLHPPGTVVVLSDGRQTGAGTTPEDATASAYVYGIPIAALAVGTPRAFVTQRLKVSGFRTSVRTAVPASPQTLESIARTTSGPFVSLTAAKQVPKAAAELASVYTENKLRPIAQRTRRTHDLGTFTAGLALVCLAGGVLGSGRWYGRTA